ncbi:transglutaminase-like domain-containing protein [Desulfocurvus sp. DL9XJH121]
MNIGLLRAFFGRVVWMALGAAVLGGAFWLLAGHQGLNSAERALKAWRYNRILHVDQVDPGLVERLKGLGLLREDLPAYCNNMVFDLSVKANDLEFNGNVPLITERMNRLLAGEDLGKAPIKCDSRALALIGLLRKLGFETRMVHYLGYADQGEFNGHTLLEVREAGGWVLYDPYFGVYFETPGGRRAAALDILRAKPEAIVPVSPLGRGWEANAGRVDRDALDHLYCVLVYDNRMNGEKSVALVNNARIKRVTRGRLEALDPALTHYMDAIWIDPVRVDI